MRSKQRNEYILQRALQDGFLSISDAAQAMNVSIETVRRDINKLNNDGLLRKVRGGAEPIEKPLRKDISRRIRLYENEEEKKRVGEIAAKMIRDNSIIGLDDGISIQVMVDTIYDVKNVTFITNSLPIATILSDKLFRKEITGRLIFIGGEINIENYHSYGALTLDALKAFNFDQVFLSCTALSAQGVSDYNTEEGFFSAYLAKHSLQSILLATKDKLGKKSVYKYAELTDFDFIVLDDPSSIPSDIKKAVKKSSTKLIYTS